MTYVKIPIDKLESFLLSRRFEKHGRLPNSKEAGYKKKFIDKELMIVVISSFEGNKQRGYGKDAIRCQLQSRSRTKYPLVDLSATKRETNWENNLGYKIDLLEQLISTSQPCPICRSKMHPIHSMFEPKVLWICDARERCRGSRHLSDKLAKDLYDNWPKHKKRLK